MALARIDPHASRRARGQPGVARGEAGEESERAEITAIVPAGDEARLERAAEALARELADGLGGFAVTVSLSRRVADPVDLHRAGQEARLAANVGEAEGHASSPSRTPAPTACCCRR